MRRGITLLEALVAAVLLSVGMLGALQVVSSCADAARQSRDQSRALMFARSKLEEILKEPVLRTGTDRGLGVDTTTDYDWEAVIEATSDPSLVLIAVTARNRVSGRSVTITALRRPDISTPQSDTGSGAAAPATGETT